MSNENQALREEMDRASMFEDVVGSSEALRKVLRQVDKVAASDSTVLVLGTALASSDPNVRQSFVYSRRYQMRVDSDHPGAHFDYRGEVMASDAKRLRFWSRPRRAPTPALADSRGLVG
jgi:hypothetical protein